jgi:aspartate-semialdehyde dehydrogenase
MPFVESRGFVVVVVGATGAVGEDLARALPLSALPIRELRLVASPRSTVSSVEIDGRDLAVGQLTDPVSDSPVLDGASLVFFATPPEVTRALAPTVAEMVPAVIDVGSSLAGDAPLWVPFAGTRTVEEIAQQGQIIGSPSAAAVAIATVLGPLVRLGASACRATVLVSAGSAGRAGVEELSQQVVALFNTREPPRTVFPTGLAFDLLPQVGEVGPDGVSSVESRVVAEVAAAVALAPEQIFVTVLGVPTFSGIGLEMHVEIDPLPDLADIRAELEGVPTLELGEPIPGPKRLVGKSRLRIGRLRADPLGTGVHLVAMGDNLRFGASGNAVAIAIQLWRSGILDEAS